MDNKYEDLFLQTKELPTKTIHLELQGEKEIYNVSLVPMHILPDNKTNDNFIKEITGIANSPDLKVYSRNEEVTGNKYKNFRNEFWLGEKSNQLNKDILNSFSSNRYTRLAEIKGLLNNKESDLKILYETLNIEKIKNWKKDMLKFETPEDYAEMTLSQKEKVSSELDNFFKDVYKDHLNIKSEDELFKNRMQ